MKTLENKIALITGSSRGLGKAMALRMAELGAKIIVTYNSNASAAETTVSEIESLGSEAFSVQLNTGKSETFDAFYKEVQTQLKALWNADTFDVLVNNAGIIAHELIAETSVETFEALNNIQLRGPFFMSQKALPLMNDGGRIINISTGLARFSLPGYGAYAAMKAGIEAFTRYLAKELGNRQITANVVAPGAIDTDMNAGAMQNPEFVNTISSLTSLGRVGVPRDISGVVAFLASEDGRWVNGQRIEASGGMLL